MTFTAGDKVKIVGEHVVMPGTLIAFLKNQGEHGMWLVKLDAPVVTWPDGIIRDDFDPGYFDKEVVGEVLAREDQIVSFDTKIVRKKDARFP